jgi:hypothetical protein
LLQFCVHSGLSVGGGVQCPGDGLSVGVLGQEATRAGGERGEERFVIGVGRQHDHLGQRMLGPHPRGGFHTVAARHPEVDEQHVGPMFGDHFHRFEPVRRGTDDLHPRQKPQ